MIDRDPLRVAAAVCRATARGDSLAPFSVLGPPIGELVAIGRKHRCLPLLAPLLEPLVVENTELARELSMICAAAWASYQLTSSTLAPVLLTAHQENIAVIVYKGAAQAARYYRDPWRRQMQDVDLLVSPEVVPRIGALLREAGYHTITTPGRSRSVELSHERTYVNAQSGIRIVDLHTAPAPPSRHPFDFDTLLARARRGEILGGPAWLLAPEDELVVAAVNQAYDHFRGSLLRAIDGAIITTSEVVDWNRVLDGARRARARAATFVTLAWMHDLAAADVPADVMETLAPDLGRRLWLAVLLRSNGRGAPRVHLHRRIEQALLTFPLIDDMRGFAAYVGRHSVRRAMDAWRATQGSEPPDLEDHR